MLLEKTAAELAALCGGRLIGNCAHSLTGVASLSEAQETDVSFLGNEKYRDQVMPSKAGIILIPEEFTEAPPEGRAWIVCQSPSDAFNKVIELFTPPAEEYLAGIHPSAQVSSSAKVAASAHIAAGAVIDDYAEIGDNSRIMANVYVGRKSKIAADCILYPGVVVRERCLLGNRVILHSGVIVGADGFGYKSGPEGHTKIPQVGIVQIDDDVEIGANSCVDRARFGRTWIKRGTKIDNLVQVAHNVEVGENCLLVSQAGVAGSCKLENAVILAGQAGLSGHLHIGEGSIVMGQAGVSKNLPAGSIVIGSPAMDRREYARQQLYINRLDKTRDTIKELQKEIEELKKGLENS